MKRPIELDWTKTISFSSDILVSFLLEWVCVEKSVVLILPLHICQNPIKNHQILTIIASIKLFYGLVFRQSVFAC